MISYRVILIEIFFMYSTGQILDDINATNTSLVNDPSMNDTIFTESTSIPTQINDSIVSLVDQLNTYRDARILARIKQCDPNMRLNEICEKYSIDNETNFLVRQLNIDFLTFDDLVDRLLNRTIIDKFNQSCLINNDCVNNLSENDIQLTKNIIQTKGRSFCSLEQCHSRLVVFMDSCPTLGNLNIMKATVKLSPILCRLYNEELYWNSTECVESIAYFLHVFYAFFSQFERCYEECTAECQTLKNVLTNVEQQCNDDTFFTSEVSTLAWYPSMGLGDICSNLIIPRRPLLMYSARKLASLNRFWHRHFKQPVYVISMIIFSILLLVCLLLCCCLRSKSCFKNIRRSLNNDYDYRRLENSSIELGTHSEVPCRDSTINDLLDEDSLTDMHSRFSSSEYQRLLFVNS